MPALSTLHLKDIEKVYNLETVISAVYDRLPRNLSDLKGTSEYKMIVDGLALVTSKAVPNVAITDYANKLLVELSKLSGLINIYQERIIEIRNKQNLETANTPNLEAYRDYLQTHINRWAKFHDAYKFKILKHYSTLNGVGNPAVVAIVAICVAIVAVALSVYGVLSSNNKLKSSEEITKRKAMDKELLDAGIITNEQYTKLSKTQIEAQANDDDEWTEKFKKIAIALSIPIAMILALNLTQYIPKRRN